MKKLTLASAGALVLSLAIAGASKAQTFDLGGAAVPPPPASTQTAPEQYVLVDGEAASRGRLVPIRSETQHDFALVSLSEIQRVDPQNGRATFDRINSETERTCARSARYVAHVQTMIERAQANGQRWLAFRSRIPELERASNNATWWRRAGGVGTVLLTGGLALPSAIGYEMQGSAYDRQVDVNLDMMDATIEKNVLDTETRLLDFEMRIWWFEEMDEHCEAMGIYRRLGITSTPN